MTLSSAVDRAPCDPVPQRVLLVDDDPASLSAMPDLFTLRLPSLSVECCESVEHAIERMTTQDYAAVISDVRMPKTLGTALLEQARRIRPCVPLLFVTGAGNLTEGEQLLHAGAFGYLAKPIDRDEVVALVGTAIKLHGLTHRVQARQARVLALAQRLKRIEALYRARPDAGDPTSTLRLRHQAAVTQAVELMKHSEQLLADVSHRLVLAKREQLRQASARLKRD